MSQKIKALFVDDSVIAAKRAKRVFGEVCDIDFAAQLSDALELILENQYDVLLVDYTPKVGIGIQLARTVRGMENYQDTPILVFSAALTNQVEYAAMKAGVNECFDKLSPPELVLEAIQKQVAEPYQKDVKLKFLETRCVEWRLDNMFYQYAPEFDLTVSGLSREDAHEKMTQELLSSYNENPDVRIFADEIDLCMHCIKVN